MPDCISACGVALTSRDWRACRPFWFRCSRAYRIASILAGFPLAVLRSRWNFEPGRIRALILVRDLHSPLPPLVEALLSQGICASHILLLDSGSTSPDCLDTLSQLEAQGCRWIRFSRNEQKFGPYAPWLSTSLRREIRSWQYPYLVTDPDLQVPVTIPQNWLAELFRTLNSHRFVLKVALPLVIDDLDLSHPNILRVVRHEQSLYRQSGYSLLTRLFLANHPGAAVATTDTTLALYRPMRFFSTLSIRLSFDYGIRHLPWYEDFVATSDYKYYQAHKLSLFGEWSSLSAGSSSP
jgi:hypothetical protein